MNFPGDAAALSFNGMSSNVAKQKQILQGLAQMANDSLHPMQDPGEGSARGHCPSKRRPAGLPARSTVTPMTDFQPNSWRIGPGKRGRSFRRRPSLRFQPKPSPGPSSSFQHTLASGWSSRKPSLRVKGRFSGVRRVSSPSRYFQTKMRSMSVSRKTRIASSQLKARINSPRTQAQGFSHSLLHFNLPGQMGKELLFGCVAPLPAAQERHARSGSKSSSGKSNPRDHLLPGKRTIECRSNKKSKCDDSGEDDRTARPPANSRCECHEQIDKPEGDHGSSKNQEDG